MLCITGHSITGKGSFRPDPPMIVIIILFNFHVCPCMLVAILLNPIIQSAGSNTTDTLSSGHMVLCMAPSTSHSSSALSIPLHHPTTVLLAFLVISSPQLYPAGWCFLFLTISSSVLYFPMCSATLLCIFTLGICMV